jgi:quercetin dioxygenase-like cupin family protein
MRDYSGNDIFDEAGLAEWVGKEFADADARSAELQKFRELVPELALAVPQISPPLNLKARLLAKIETEAEKPFVSPALFSLFADEGEWVTTAPGVETKTLFTDKASGLATSLYRFAPGATVGPHRHLGNEQCYILSGDFHVGEQVFGAGDFHCAAEGSIHPSISTTNGTLLLIIAPAEYEPLT